MDVNGNAIDIARVARSYPFRLCVYAAVTVAFFQGLYLLATHSDIGSLGAENGPIEVAQVVLVVFAAALFYRAYRRANRGRSGLLVCGALLTYAAARELDSVFESLLFDDAYKYLVGLPLLLIVARAVASRREHFLEDCLWLLGGPSATMFFVGGLFLCCICQFLDRSAVWASISSPTETAAIKVLIEESMELFAYLLLAFSGVEAAASVGSQSIRLAGNDDTNSLEREPRVAA